ncbi:MAG: GNAT family N-acetyltransferase, partial [Oscillospiraceae bacterium]
AATGYDEDSLYVAIIGGKIAGTCILNNKQEEAYTTSKWQAATDNPLVVHTLAVNPDFLKQGIAQKLLAFADELAKKDGIHSIRLDTAEGNLPARKLYEKVGYQHMGFVDLGLERSGISCWYIFEKLV